MLFLRARETNKERDRQTQRESEESERYRERDRSRNRSYLARTHTREKEIGTRELPVLPSRRSSPRKRINVPNKTGLMLPVSILFSRNLLPLASSVFLDVRMRTGKASREKRQFLSCSLSLLSISHFTLSLTAQRRPTVLVSQ